MKRRTLLAGLAGTSLAAGMPGSGQAEARSGWTDWKARFLTEDGRVVDHLQGDVSHSEGQGYGLLLAQAHGDRAAFEAIEDWTRRHLLIRDDPLMAWRWRPGVTDRGADWHTASDGDLFRAWALFRAASFSRWDGHDRAAADIAHALAALCLAPDPRAPDEPVLRPGAEAADDGPAVLFNPSYIMPRALRELGVAYDASTLVRAADHGETILAELAAGGLLPDWTLITDAGFAAPDGLSQAHGYDATRVALYLAWSGRADHPACVQKRHTFRIDGETPVVLDRDGTVVNTSSYPGYRALKDFILCAPLDPQTRSDEPYYPATLGLLTGVARRESSACFA